MEAVLLAGMQSAGTRILADCDTEHEPPRQHKKPRTQFPPEAIQFLKAWLMSPEVRTTARHSACVGDPDAPFLPVVAAHG